MPCFAPVLWLPCQLVERLQVRTSRQPTDHIIDEDTHALIDMLNDGSDDADSQDFDLQDMIESEGASEETSEGPRLLVINGPNINMLGLGAPLYATEADYAELLTLCHKSAREAGFARCECYQSNHEGDLIDCIQDAQGCVDGIVINAGSYGHTSTALLDALETVNIPAVEVCLMRVDEPAGLANVTYLRSACFETITDSDIVAYQRAIFDLADELGLTD